MNTHAPSMDNDISRAWFMRTLLVHLAPISDAILGNDGARAYTRRVGLTIANAVEAQYPELSARATPMTQQEFADFTRDFRERLGGVFTVEMPDEDTLLLATEHCPWVDVTPHVPGLCALLLAVYGWLAARQFGYACVVHEAGAMPESACRILIYLHPPAEATRLAGDEFWPDTGTGDTTPQALLLQYQGEIDAMRATPGAFLHCHLAATQRLERALDAERVAHEQLRTVARLKEDFLSTVSHELRTPITAMQGYLSLLEQEVLGTVTPEQRQALQVTRRNLERLHVMVRDLLDYTALTRGDCPLQMEPVEVADVLTAAVSRIAPTARDRCITLEVRFPPVVGRVRGDADKLTQVVAHLLENAVKFSEAGRMVSLDAVVEGRQARIEVCDRGIGMTTEQLHHVFTPFTQADSGLARRFGGLGMGLSLIRNLVQIHGGEIAIASTPGSGTTARVVLPLADVA